MSDLQTNVGIRVINDASEPLQKVTNDMNEMTKTLQKAGNDAGVSQSLSGIGKSAQEASKGLSGMKGFIGDVAGALSPFSLSSAGLAAAVVFIGKASMSAAEEIQTVGNRAKAVFGSDFPAAQASAESLSTVLKRDVEDLLKMEASFAAMARGAGVSSKASLELSEDMTKVAVSFARINGLSDEEAFTKMQQGIAGMGRSLKEYGLFVDDAAMSEYAHAKGIKVKFEELDEAGKVLVRSMYLEEKQAELQKNLGEMNVTLGETWKELVYAIDPYLEAMGKVVNFVVIEFLDAMAGGLQTATIMIQFMGAVAKDTAAQIYNMGVSVANFFGVATGAQKMSTDNVNTQLSALMMSSKETSSSMQSDLQGTTKKTEDLIAALNSGKFKSSGGMSAANDDAKKLKKSMEDLGKEFNDTFGDLASKSKEAEMKHKEAIDGMILKQRDLYEKLNDLRAAATDTAAAFADIGVKFKQTMDDLNTQSIESVGQQLQKIKDLSYELKRADQQSGSLSADQIASRIENRTDKTSLTLSVDDAMGLSSAQEEQVNKTMQLHREQAAYTEYLVKALNLNKEIANTIAVGSYDYVRNAEKLITSDPNLAKGISLTGQTDFAKTQANIKKQAGQAQVQYDKDTEQNVRDQEDNLKQQQKVKDDIAALDKKRKAVEYAYQLERAEIGYTKVALDAFHGQYLNQMTDMASVTEKTVQNVKTQLELLRQVLQQAQQDAQYAAQATANASSRGSSRAKFADGGVVSSRAGGMDVTVGEGMYNEAIVPLPDGRSIPVRIEGSTGGRGDVYVSFPNMIIQKTADANEVLKIIAREVQKLPSQSY